MAMQIGFTKLVFIVGAGYTTTILLNNGKLYDVLRELHGHGADSDYADAVSGQVRRLAMEVRQLASGNQITVVTGGSTAIVSSLVVPAAAAGAVGYGYMRWKGLSFSDLMYVTKENMDNAVESLKSNLGHISEAIAGAKKYLIQRIDNLNDKVNEERERANKTHDEVVEAIKTVDQIHDNLDRLTERVSVITDRMLILEEKQDLTNRGVWHLCDQLDRNTIPPNAHLEQLNFLGQSSGRHLSYQGMLSLEGIREIVSELDPTDLNTTNGAPRNLRCIPQATSRLLTRTKTLNFVV